jgi:hypothetical protein
MTQDQPGPRWAQQQPPGIPESAADGRPLRRRPKFWVAIVVTYAAAFACAAAVAGASDSDDQGTGNAAAKPGPTVTALETVTAEPEPAATKTVTAEPEPAVTVTQTEEVEVLVTETVVADGGGSDDGGENVWYANCTAARDAGAAPVRRGDPGYGGHLDRDGDGVGCE